MANKSLGKGKRGEREVVTMLNSVLEQVTSITGQDMTLARRNLDQWQLGGEDIATLDGFAIEVKYRETEAIAQWWDQVVAAARKGDRTPVLFYRASRRPWRVRTIARLDTVEIVADIASEDWLAYLKRRLIDHHGIGWTLELSKSRALRALLGDVAAVKQETRVAEEPKPEQSIAPAVDDREAALRFFIEDFVSEGNPSFAASSLESYRMDRLVPLSYLVERCGDVYSFNRSEVDLEDQVMGLVRKLIVEKVLIETEDQELFRIS